MSDNVRHISIEMTEENANFIVSILGTTFAIAMEDYDETGSRDALKFAGQTLSALAHVQTGILKAEVRDLPVRIKYRR